MCRQATCKDCGKATWAGCGQHIEQALAGVPKSQRCACIEADKAAAKATQGSFLSRMLGR